MKLNLVKLAEGATVGLLDIGLEKIDESQGLVAPLNAQTIGRIGIFGASLVGQLVTDKWHDHLETLMVAEEPLVIRSLAKLGGIIADYAEAPSREAIELRLRQAGGMAGQLRKARFH